MSAMGPDDEAIEDAAIEWVVRRDRGLSAAEATQLQAWLAQDPRHQEALEQSSFAWGKLEPPQEIRWARPPRWRPTARRWVPAVCAGLAAAALFVAMRWRPPTAEALPPTLAANVMAGTVTRALADGSTAQLNRGATISEEFSADERRVTLHQGEAFFEVAKDARRPFIVSAGTVRVRALGTAFSTRWNGEGVDVIVTEGVVRVDAAEAGAAGSPATALTQTVSAAQRATVSRGTGGATQLVVAPVTPAQIATLLAWRDPLLTFDGAPLAQVVQQFQRASGHRISITDTATAALQIGGSFPANDLDGFIQLLSEYYGVTAKPQPDGSIQLELQHAGPER